MLRKRAQLSSLVYIVPGVAGVGWDVRDREAGSTRVTFENNAAETILVSLGRREGVAPSTPVARCVHRERADAGLRGSSLGVDGATASTRAHPA